MFLMSLTYFWETFTLSLTIMPVTSCLAPLFCRRVFSSLILKPCPSIILRRLLDEIAVFLIHVLH